MSKVLIFDPAGNKKEGSGTSGWAIFENGELKEFGTIRAEDFPTAEAYWQEHVNFIQREWPDHLVCESYKLFGHKSQQQIGSELETPQLIGIIRLTCFQLQIPMTFQDPKDKPRFSDEILDDLGVTTLSGKIRMCLGKRTCLHERDAIRHGLFYLRYGKPTSKAVRGEKKHVGNQHTNRQKISRERA